MTADQDRISLARHYFAKARDRYNDGLILKNMDRYESAANRLYYALFHATNAVLALKGVASNRHRGVKTLFDMHYIKSGIMDRKYSKLFCVFQDYIPLIGMHYSCCFLPFVWPFLQDYRNPLQYGIGSP